MQHSNRQPLTPSELRDICNRFNRLHRRVWTALAVIMAVCALIWNPYHLLTAALFLLFSRAEWTTSDIATLEK